jgi:hypothetical protein
MQEHQRALTPLKATCWRAPKRAHAQANHASASRRRGVIATRKRHQPKTQSHTTSVTPVVSRPTGSGSAFQASTSAGVGAATKAAAS